MMSDNDMDKINQRRKQKAKSNTATDILNQWLLSHIDNPYPTQVEYLTLSQQTSKFKFNNNLSSIDLTETQIKNWFCCRRHRLLARRRLEEKSKKRTLENEDSEQQPKRVRSSTTEAQPAQTLEIVNQQNDAQDNNTTQDSATLLPGIEVLLDIIKDEQQK
jgi:E3 ubiquitin-protein ligase DOA10